MFANLIPLPGGVGGVDAGLLGAFALFGVSRACSRPCCSTGYCAFWLPIPPGIVAFLQLRKTVQRWERERDQSDARPIGESAPVRRYFIK